MPLHCESWHFGEVRESKGNGDTCQHQKRILMYQIVFNFCRQKRQYECAHQGIRQVVTKLILSLSGKFKHNFIQEHEPLKVSHIMNFIYSGCRQY